MKILFSLVIGSLFGVIFYTYHTGEINLLLRTLGYVAFAFLSISLIVSPSMRLLGSNHLIGYRRIFGVLAFFVALAHSLKYFFDEYTYNQVFFIAKHFLELDVLSGTISLILMSVLGITSLQFFIRLLGSHWKNIQTLIFPLYCIAGAHIAFASRFDIGYMVMIAIVVLMRISVYLFFESPKISDRKQGVPGGRWLCVPCGYIYDPKIGDIDSGIAPGTSFENIPETWKCPVCGVSKSDFIPLEETSDTVASTEGEIISHTLLNPTTLELKIKSEKKYASKVGQYMKYTLHDRDGDFSRCYSIVEEKDGVFTFTIKLKGGRAARILEKKKAGDTLGVDGVYGNFTLQDTENPKVCIASGTGLAPIMRMLRSLEAETKKVLYFSVSHKDELFYIEELKSIPNLEAIIHVTQESVPGYGEGRISLDGLTYPKNTEFYLCGTPGLVSSATDVLKSQGYNEIYSEKF
ncbi:rubredoxin [Candidatus Gracilibacteria bacterium]|nr:rubredoxin [Candidatus Gracilibacteria bacterium]